MNEQSKANEWEFWDFDISAYLHDTAKKEQSKNSNNNDDDCQCKTHGSSVDCPKDHILPSHLEAAAEATHEEDDVDLAWREFDSYESVMGSPNIHRKDEQPEDIIETKKSPPTTPTRKQPTKSLSASRDKSQSPPRRLIDVKSNTRGARAA